MVSAFESALDKLAIGGISEPVLTPFGYHIIKLESRTEERFKPLEEVREEVIQSLKEIKARQKVRRTAKHIYQDSEKTGDLKSAAEKSADGLVSLQWYKEGKINKIIQYCKQDVEITRDLYLYGEKHGFVKYQSRSGNPLDLKVDWKTANLI